MGFTALNPSYAGYIHINPVKHGLVARVSDWPYSSFHRMVKLGIYPANWAGDVANDEEAFGEPFWTRVASDGFRKRLNPSYGLHLARQDR